MSYNGNKYLVFICNIKTYIDIHIFDNVEKADGFSWTQPRC